MTEPVANADDRQPGGSGAGSTVVTLDLSELAQHVVTSEWLAEVKAKFTKLQMDLAQSRATEAELRAALRILLGECCAVGRGRCENVCHIQAWAALDAAEQPAPPKTAPRVRSANASVSDDRSDLETAEGPL